MGRIVVNKHFDVKSNITPESFAHKGEIIISNQVGFEGIFIKNNNGEIFYIAPTEGTGTDVPLEYKEYVESFVNGRLEGYITQEEFEELIKNVQIDPTQVRVIANEEIASALTVYSTTEEVNAAIEQAVSAIKIPSLEGYATESWVSAEIAKAQLEGEDVDLSGYATKEDIKDFVTYGWVEGQGFLTEHQDITGKQDVIEDLEAIRSGASLGATALQEIPTEAMRQIAAEEVIKIVNSADSRYDTLKEISDWILSDTTGAASMANDIQSLKAQLNALTLGAKASTSISKSSIYVGEENSITVTGRMEPNTLTPCTVSIYKGSDLMASANTSVVSYTELVTGATSYNIKAVYNGTTYTASTRVNAYHPTYYGFGVEYNDVLSNKNLLSSAKRTYTDTANADGVYYYILVPDGVSKPSSFTMGGAPFNMGSTNETINGVNYIVFKSGSIFNNGGNVNIVAA